MGPLFTLIVVLLVFMVAVAAVFDDNDLLVMPSHFTIMVTVMIDADYDLCLFGSCRRREHCNTNGHKHGKRERKFNHTISFG